MSSKVRTKHRANDDTAFGVPESDCVAAWDPLSFLPSEEEEELECESAYIRTIGTASEAVRLSYGFDEPQAKDKVFGFEVGDDRQDFGQSPLRLATGLVSQELISLMSTSEEDTFISPHVTNFCEVTSWIPRAKEESFHYARKSGNFRNLGFADVPPLRIILDVKKADRSHSSTQPGKVTMLGSRARTPRTEFLQDWNLASFMQDGLLRTSMASEPKYLPQVMGGSGVPSQYGSALNLYLYVHAYRAGRCQRVYGTACQELSRCLDLLERGQASMPTLCRRLRDKQEYLHATYAEKVFVPKKILMDPGGESMPRPLIEGSAGANWSVAYENRLIRTKHLVPRSVAEREWAYTQRVRSQMLSGMDIPSSDTELKLEKLRARNKFGMALAANTAFANMLSRNASLKDVAALTNEDFLVVNTGVTRFTLQDAAWLVGGGRKETCCIDDLDFREDLFLRSEVSEEETYKVGNIPLDVQYSGGTRRYRTTTSVGLYQINEGMREWSEDLTHRLILRAGDKRPMHPSEAHQEFIKNPEWVNDDSTIIARAIADTQWLNYRSARVVLVSDDRRLANQLSNQANCMVLRIPSRSYIVWAIGKGLDPLVEPKPEVLTNAIPHGGRMDPVRCVYIDTGSVGASLAMSEKFQLGSLSFVRKKEFVGASTKPDGTRVATYRLGNPESMERMIPERHTPVIIPRRNRYIPSYSSFPQRRAISESWREPSSLRRRPMARSAPSG